MTDDYTLSTVMPGPGPARRTRWIIPVIITASLLAIGGGIAAAALFGRGVLSGPGSAESKTPTLRLAYETCGNVGELSDADNTLYLDMRGEDVDSGNIAIADVMCVLQAIGTPTSVIHKMENTRALDGHRGDGWGAFEASWSYHPDNGLDIILTETRLSGSQPIG